jgi:hydrogenase expression/formation protein HypD
MRTASAADWLERIHGLGITGRVRIMNVCGGHERAITLAGLRTALPPNIELIPGPGCPVCICPEEDIFTAIRLALDEDITLVAFGDLLRVPVNVPRGEARSLEEARTRGADIRPIASPQEAGRLARAHPERPLVFFAAGFEPTMAPVAALLVEGVPDNLLFLLSGRLTWPAVALLLSSDRPGFHALVAPGHVATVMGPEQWRFVVERHGIPTAVAGFTPVSLLAAIYSSLRQLQEGRPFLDNCYPEVVKPGGNPTAQRHLRQALYIIDGSWRGIGMIPASGFALAPRYQDHDARRAYLSHADTARRRAGEMPPGCDCAQVVLGKIYPNECRLFGTACRPRHPVGPCMVSDEGACRIWWSGGLRAQHLSPSAQAPQG